jgi:hypothetical protein
MLCEFGRLCKLLFCKRCRPVHMFDYRAAPSAVTMYRRKANRLANSNWECAASHNSVIGQANRNGWLAGMGEQSQD